MMPRPKSTARAVRLPKIAVKRVTGLAELQRAYAIRIRVFVNEQGVPRDIELDDDDRQAHHFLASVGGRTVGTARVVLTHGAAKIGRMAVLKSYRRRGVGSKLLKRAIAMAQQLHVSKIYLHAQIAVIDFYRCLNFYAVGPVFDEAGIAHRKMLWRGQPRRAGGKKKRLQTNSPRRKAK